MTRTLLNSYILGRTSAGFATGYLGKQVYHWRMFPKRLAGAGLGCSLTVYTVCTCTMLSYVAPSFIILPCSPTIHNDDWVGFA